MMAVDQGLKIRPILNVSSPEGESFNDNVDEFLCEKVQMATARNVSYMIKAAGKDCLLYKTDIKDAYKIVPAKIEDLRLQGFALLGKYFVNQRMMLDRFSGLDEPTVLLKWMKNPLPNWDLAREIISVVKSKI